MEKNEEEDIFTCEHCGSTNFDQFVQYGSYILNCAECKEHLFATSFIATVDMSSEMVEAFEVNEDSHKNKLIIKGKLNEIAAVVRSEAGKGKLIWLKLVGTPA